MLQAELQDREMSALMRALAEEPQSLGRGLRLLEAGFRLTPELVVDAWMQDAAARPVIVLGEGSGGEAGLLGRAWCVLAEVRRMRSLLERLFQREGARFDDDPRVIVVAARFSDALHGLRDRLADCAIDLVEARLVSVDGKHRLVVVPAGGVAHTDASPASDSSPRSVRTPITAAAVASGTPNVSATVAPKAASVGQAPVLLDELKRKVLHLNERIEEEVVGATTSFRFHDQVLATVTRDDRCLMATVGDSDETARPIADRGGLNALLDEVVRRYFSLARPQRNGAHAPAAGSACT